MPTGISNGSSNHMRRLQVEAQEEMEQARIESLPENAMYWKDKAIAEFNSLAALVGCKLKADELTGDWDDGRTWKQIYKDAAKIYDDLRKAPLFDTSPKSLNDMTLEEQRQWFADVEEVEIP